MIFVERLKKWDFVFVLFFISALAYLPHINQFGYYRDDWYLMYSANALGVGTFKEIFAIDRPVRSVLMTLLYSLFGMEPLGYHIIAYVLRFLGALSFWWSLNLLWSKQKTATVLVALFFLIYPGFLSTPNAIDYEEKFVGLFLGHLSVALSIKAVLTEKRSSKIFLWISSVFLGSIYLTFVEYYLGLEVFRFLAFFLLAIRSLPNQKFFQTFLIALRSWIPFSIGSLAFFIWRFFIFDSQRKATDLGAQLTEFIESPLLVGINWTMNLIKDVFEGLVLTWGYPLTTLWDISLRLREIFYAGVLLCVCISVVVFFLRSQKNIEENHSESNWQTEAIWIGLICTLTGFIPVIISNRHADFYNYSRYMLPSSSGIVLVMVAFLFQLRLKQVRNVIIYGLIGISVLTHYLNGIHWARSNQAMQNFWWQVSWRIPQIKENTTLVVNYSHTAVEEDYFIWGPANLMYHPQSKSNERIEPALWGLVLTRENAVSILNDAPPSFLNRRSIVTYLGYDNILIITQPSLSSCVQVIDSNMPIVSAYEQYDIEMIASESNQNNILLDEDHAPLSDLVFGSEPQHDWCFYYQTASLAFQRGEYETVLEIKQKAKRAGFFAQDPVEWMPFLQSAILLEDYEQASEMVRFIKKDSFLQLQVCSILPQKDVFNEEMKDFIRKTFCIN
jgi:hypothetical protein